MICLDVSYDIEKDSSGKTEELVYVTKTYVRPDGHIYRKTTLNGLAHSGPFDEPSMATFDPNGNPIEHSWHAFGKEHRIYGPSTVVFHEGTDKPRAQMFKISGKPRLAKDGPFCVYLNQDGSLRAAERADGTPWECAEPAQGLEP